MNSSSSRQRVTPVGASGTDYDDAFCVTVRRVTSTNFVLNTYRIDSTTTTCGQQLRISYHAWQ